MYHGVGYRKLGRKTPHRMAMFANAASSLIQCERIETTLPKAKDLRRVVERLVTKAKNGTPHDRRMVMSFLRNSGAVEKLFDTLAPRFRDRKGGYTRVLKSPVTRWGDAAEMAVLEFVDFVLPAETSKEEDKKARKAAKAKASEDRKAAKASQASAKGRESPSSKVGRKSGKAGASSTMKGSGSRGT